MNGINKLYDVAIAGGGASGMCAAVSVKKSNSALSVVILEELPRVGKKLLITGNGRCNITNRFLSVERYHGENREFCRYALEKYDAVCAEKFFSGIGVLFYYEDDGRAYPYSLQASSVVDALRFECDKLGVETVTDCRVNNISFKNEVFTIDTENGEIKAKNTVIAAGLYSGGEKLGCDGSMLGIMKRIGFKTVKTTPAIVQLRTETEIVRQLKGIKINAEVTLLCNGRRLRSESGELLFCDYGLSGPPVMQVSREVTRGVGEYSVLVDIMPEYDFNTLCGLITDRAEKLSDRTLDEFFTGMLNKRVGQTIIKLAGLRLSDGVRCLDTQVCKRLVKIIKGMEFRVTGTNGFSNSQVTAGGLDTAQFDNKTMMSKSINGLYAIGEILDIDGDCGGFNLQWAWSSAMCAADGITRRK